MSFPVDFDIDAIIELAQNAGKKILGIYDQDFKIYNKNDKSLLTEADILSHNVIMQGLAQLTPGVPVLSEESSKRDIEERTSWKTFWLIDPLDGTKEFVKKNGEFTVNIALVHNHEPVFGVVDAPVWGVSYWGGRGIGAHKIEKGELRTFHTRRRPKSISDWKVVGSRSHHSRKFRNFMTNYPEAQIISMGSSLKFCMVAEGSADLYPRFGTTSEWDTAASQAIVEAAGGQVLRFPEKTPLRYNENHKDLLNPYFLVCGEPL